VTGRPRDLARVAVSEAANPDTLPLFLVEAVVAAPADAMWVRRATGVAGRVTRYDGFESGEAVASERGLARWSAPRLLRRLTQLRCAAAGWAGDAACVPVALSRAASLACSAVITRAEVPDDCHLSATQTSGIARTVATRRRAAARGAVGAHEDPAERQHAGGAEGDVERDYRSGGRHGVLNLSSATGSVSPCTVRETASMPDARTIIVVVVRRPPMGW
jgi:hypothetical protein